MTDRIEYAELHCHSNYSFLDGASHPEELVATAAALGYRAIALTDRDGLYAAVQLDEAAKEHRIKPVFGATITLEAGGELTLLARDAAGYQNLSQLITRGRRARPKGRAAVAWDDLARHAVGLIALTGTMRGVIPTALLRDDADGARALCERLLELYGPGSVYLELTNHLLPYEARLFGAVAELARRMDLPIVATQDARYATPDRRPLQDILTAIRHRTSVREAGTLLMPNGEFFLQPLEELARRFRALPEALRNTLVVADQCTFALPQLRFDLPTFPVPAPWRSELEYLEHLTFANAHARFPEVGHRVVQQLRHELEVIGRHRLEGYFLIVWDIVSFCHKSGILAQGRGSAANSAVCFALGITNVDPIRLELLFERFLSEGRNEAPDIDLDIANDRREEVIQYVYERYGREHAGMVCEVICFRARSAVRDVGKALGLTLDQVNRMSRDLEVRRFSEAPPAPSTDDNVEPIEDEAFEDAPAGAAAVDVASFNAASASSASASSASASAALSSETATASETGPRLEGSPHPPAAPELEPEERRIADMLWDFCLQIEGFPRHLGIHVGGMIICAEPLSRLVPIENATMPGRTVVQWDKDDVGALKMPKIDLLGLGMLSAIGEAVRLIEAGGGPRIDFARLTYDDPAVYDLICRGDTVGVFQVESRAQMSVIPRLQPRKFYDLVVQVSLIRPGPIQGDMVHPYLRRRNGDEPVTYPHPDLEPVLERTLGIPLFQEQGMKVAVIAAGFSPSEADALRRAMSSKRKQGQMGALTGRLLEGMRRNGYDDALAERVVSQIKAFASYGFPESHAASFALLVYISAWLKHYHFVAYFAALLNCQPMGFYAPSTLVNEVKRKGYQVLPVDIVQSQWTWTPSHNGLRAGLGSLRGFAEAQRRVWEDARRHGPWKSVEDVCARTGWSKLLLERLASTGALESLGVTRREALWRVQGFRTRPDLAAPQADEAEVRLATMSTAEALLLDMRNVGHSTESHPIQLMRPTLDRWKVVKAGELAQVRNGASLRVAGVVTVRQRPPTAKGFCFLTLEDETGMINIIVRPDKYEEYRSVVRRAMIVLIEGTLQYQKGLINIRAEKVAALDDRWAEGIRSRDFK